MQGAAGRDSRWWLCGRIENTQFALDHDAGTWVDKEGVRSCGRVERCGLATLGPQRRQEEAWDWEYRSIFDGLMVNSGQSLLLHRIQDPSEVTQ